MELTWTELDTGAIAQGREEVYLVIADQSVLPSDVTEARLTRWRAGAQDACWQALRNAVVFPLGAGAARLAVQERLRQLQADCQRYENGEQVKWVLWHPAWRRGAPPPLPAGPRWEDMTDETKAFFDALHGADLNEGL